MPDQSNVALATATYKTAGGRTRSADTREARALRGLQILDQLQRETFRPRLERDTMRRVQDALGDRLSLPACSCDDGGVLICARHEWLVMDDYHAADIPGDVHPTDDLKGATA